MTIKVICQNRKARFDYFIEETYEAGIVLVGCEVKSLRMGRANLVDSYARIMRGEIYLVNTHIAPYAWADATSKPDPYRTRKLLLHKKEIEKLIGKTKEKGYTLIPTKIYFKDGKAKVSIGLCRGKKQYDKRESLKKKTIEREMKQTMKNKR